MVPDKLERLAILQAGSLKGVEVAGQRMSPLPVPLLLHGVRAHWAGLSYQGAHVSGPLSARHPGLLTSQPSLRLLSNADPSGHWQLGEIPSSPDAAGR